MRFRLLSYMAAILLLSGVLGANLMPVTSTRPPDPLWGRATIFTDPEGNSFVHGPRPMPEAWDCTRYGWPLTASTSEWFRWPPDCLTGGEPFRVWSWHWSALVTNIAIGLAIPIAGLQACEFVLRRYSPRRKVE